MSTTAVPPAASPASGAEAVAALFTRTYGEAPAVIASAPGRVNLIGEHTDYNGGEVLPIAIGRRTHVAARANGLGIVRALSANESDAGQFAVRGAAPDRKWWDYVAGLMDRLAAHGVEPVGADLAVWSDLPARAGLGSSAALAIAAGLAITAASGHTIVLRQLARIARRAEEEYVGVSVGIMDQMASALAQEGQALRIWCDREETALVPFREHVLVFDTRVPRALRTGAFNTRRAECERALSELRRTHPALPDLAAATPEQVQAAALEPPLDRRARHVVSETRRVGLAADALARGELFPGALLAASHASLRDDFECSCAELDWFAERAPRAPGVRGARMVGAGWGGCAIALGERPALENAALAIADEYRVRFRRTARWWVTAASSGAAVGPYRST
jgi:galactokinase